MFTANSESLTAARTTKLRVVPSSELTQRRRAANPLIEGLITRNTLVSLKGAAGAGKSFIASQWAFSVATGVGFAGRRSETGLVVYLYGRGQAEQAARLEERLAAGSHAERTPLVMLRVQDVLDATEIVRLRAQIEAAQVRFGVPLALVVLDAELSTPGTTELEQLRNLHAAIELLRAKASALVCESTSPLAAPFWYTFADTQYEITRANSMLTLVDQHIADEARLTQTFALVRS